MKNLFPTWVEESDAEAYALCITDDIDSLASAALLQQIKGYKVNYFYDFNSIYANTKDRSKKVIGVDMAVLNGRCWDNHVTMLSHDDYVNPQSANFNAIKRINRGNYFDKYAMSTLLQVWSYYELPLPESDEGKLILMAIDSAYKGHFVNGFAYTHSKYMDMLDMPELSRVLRRYKYEDFINVIKKYNLNGKISVSTDGSLHSTIKLQDVSEHLGVKVALPKGAFELVKNLKSSAISLDGSNKKVKDMEGLFSVALTNKNFLKYTSK